MNEKKLKANKLRTKILNIVGTLCSVYLFVLISLSLLDIYHDSRYLTVLMIGWVAFLTGAVEFEKYKGIK